MLVLILIISRGAVSSAPDPSALKVQGPDTIGNPQQITTLGLSNPNSLQTPLSNSSTSTNTTLNFALGATAGKTTYVSGFTVTGSGATAASVVTVALSNVAGTTQNYVVVVPAGVTTSITPLVVTFNPALPASGVATAPTLNVPAFGAGNTNMAATITGWRE